MSVLPNEYNCPLCGKAFLARDPWGYMRNSKKYCSYPCVLEYDRRVRMSPKGKRLNAAEKKEVLSMLKDGVAPQKISEMFGITWQAVVYYQKKVMAGGT